MARWLGWMTACMCIGAAWAGCHGNSDVCVPGQSLACVGPAGCKGGQVCNADGSALEACECAGGAGGAGGGAGSGGAGASPRPLAAWLVVLMPEDPAQCDLEGSAREIGQVSDTMVTAPVADGNAGASIACSVVGTTSFDVVGSASQEGESLTISIMGITSAATMGSPVKGSVTYQSDATAEIVYASNDCDFFFSLPGEAVSSGRIWVSFTCAGVSSAGSTQSTCPLTRSYAYFENCTAT